MCWTLFDRVSGDAEPDPLIDAIGTVLVP
jgi:hypothetical protein